MLDAAKIVAFAATVDGGKSRAFYEGVLGLKLMYEDAHACVCDSQGIELRIQKVQALTPQPHTQLGWSVASIHGFVIALASKGVTFERYPFLEQDAQGVWMAPSGAKVAWMKDPDGNLLSVTER
jgi:catechol 2,3-dioxygenase-like lactoylglutathione lyase family enzyme